MPLPKSFLHQDIKSLELSKSRIIIGLVIAISFAFSFYAVTYLIRETLRVMSTTESYDLWLLSETERNFYNLFYAFISVIFGQSICFSFWLSKKRKTLGRHHYLRSSIMVDQSVLNSSFILWFSKMAFMFAAFFGLDRWGGFYVFSFYPNYKYLFVLIIIVLFLQNWVVIRRIFKNKSLKWMLLSVFIVTSLSFGLSKIDIVDYKAINKTLSDNNIYSKYNLQIPESYIYENKLENRSLVNEIYLVKNLDDNNQQEAILIIENKKVNLIDLNTIITYWKASHSEIDIHRMKYLLHIDTSISMNAVNELKLKLSSLGAIRIAYAVTPIDRKFDKRYYKNYALSIRIPLVHIYKDLPPPPPQMQPNNYENIIILDIPENNKFLIKGQKIPLDEMKSILKELIRQNTDYVLDLSTGNHVNFASYFRALSICKEAIDELRNEYAYSKYLMIYADLDEERKKQVKYQYPFALYEEIFSDENEMKN